MNQHNEALSAKIKGLAALLSQAAHEAIEAERMAEALGGPAGGVVKDRQAARVEALLGKARKALHEARGLVDDAEYEAIPEARPLAPDLAADPSGRFW